MFKSITHLLINKTKKTMQPNNDIYASLLLGALLIATNLKPIIIFREWINFKIHSSFKQYQSQRKNKPNT